MHELNRCRGRRARHAEALAKAGRLRSRCSSVAMRRSDTKICSGGCLLSLPAAAGEPSPLRPGSSQPSTTYDPSPASFLGSWLPD